MSPKQLIEVCFSPALYHRFHNNEANVVVVDILRATSAICTAFMNGAESVIPVSTLEEAREYKNNGYLVAAERDGIVRDFADFGNSPYNFTSDKVNGKTIVYSTTNGTHAINVAKDSNMVIVGSFLNFSAVTNLLTSDKRDVVILCAGWKDRFSLEDTIFAGALVEQLLISNSFETSCDSSIAAYDLWTLAKNDLSGYLKKAAQHHRLKKNKLDDVIDYCLTIDQTDIIPVFVENKLINNSVCNFINRKIKINN